MENLDDKIDSLIRDKLVSLIQENAVRIKRITVKFTKSNKKHNLEHWQAFYDSYERMFRSIPKELVRVEKEVRVKFVSRLTDERIARLKSMINSEAELLFQELANDCEGEFEKFGHGETFEKRVEQTRKKFAENLEQQIQKCIDSVNPGSGRVQKAGIQDLMKLYGVNETFLHEINIVSPLQSINSILEKAYEDPRLSEALDNLQEGFRYLFQKIQKSRSNDITTKEARKALKMEVARDTMMAREIVVNCQPFLEQLILPENKRNFQVILKSWNKFFGLLEEQDGRWGDMIPHFQPLYNFMCGKEN